MGKGDILNLIENSNKEWTAREIMDMFEAGGLSVNNGNIYNNIRGLEKQGRIRIISENPKSFIFVK